MSVRIVTTGGVLAWDGPCKTFNRWRNALAARAGYTSGPQPPPFQDWERVTINWLQFSDVNLYGRWEIPPEDILMVLLCHYATQGHIEPGHAAPLADRLVALSPPPEDDPWHGRTETFIAALRSAAASNQPIEFM